MIVRSLILVVFVLAAFVTAAAAQTAGTEREGVLAGQVVDAESGLALAGVAVVLEPVAAGVLPSRGRGDSPFLRSTVSALTQAGGEYRFTDLPRGTYRLRFQRVGYRPASLEVEIGGPAAARVSVGLTIEPVALEPVRVRTAGPNPFGNPGARAVADSSRLLAERLRQEQFLGSDVRAVTAADVAEGVTLAETDLFRAMQRLPGVSTRDDWTAELWTRGAPWDQTRVYFDGLPLFNPLHAFGIFSGVNADAIGAAFFHPGVQPASLSGGAAATLDLRSRRGGGDGELSGAGELSLASARLALERQQKNGRAAWMTAGRRSYLDVLSLAVERLGGEGSGVSYLPYNFFDIMGRSDYRIGKRSSFEFSTFQSQDEITGTLPDLLHRTAASWGTGAARMTFATPVGRLSTRHTVGYSAYSSRVERLDPDPLREQSNNAREGTPSLNSVLYLSLAGEIRPAGDAGRANWAAGYEMVGQQAEYRGPRPVSHTVTELDGSIYEGGNDLYHVAGWAERTWRPRAPLTLQTGLRVEAGHSMRNAGPVRVAPRLTARYEAFPELAFSAGVGRTYQYTQALAPTGLQIETGFNADYLWLLAGDSTPALRADIGTAGAEWWLGHSWLGSATFYLRRTAGVALPDPAPGPLTERPRFVTGEGHAHGVEFSARRLVGRWTASATYAFGRASVNAEELRFPAPGDRRHLFGATAMTRLTPSWRFGGAFSAATGAPFTRTHQGLMSCDNDSPLSTGSANDGWPGGSIWDPFTGVLLQNRCTWDVAPHSESPNAERMPGSQRLDLLVAWDGRVRSWHVGAFLQLHNALGSNNSGAYKGTNKVCSASCGQIGGEPFGDYVTVDEFLPGLPRIPVLGFRVSF